MTELLRAFCLQLRVELLRLSSRHAECLPSRGLQMLGKKYDLTYVIGVVRERAIDSLQDRMFLTANGNDTEEVIGLERLQRLEDVLPAALPDSHKRFTAGVLADNELLVAITVWFF